MNGAWPGPGHALGVYELGGQGTQADTLAYVPGGQGVQAASPADATLPGGQAVQAMEAKAEVEPAAQAVQAPVACTNTWPAGQLHTTEAQEGGSTASGQEKLLPPPESEHEVSVTGRPAGRRPDSRFLLRSSVCTLRSAEPSQEGRVPVIAFECRSRMVSVGAKKLSVSFRSTSCPPSWFSPKYLWAGGQAGGLADFVAALRDGIVGGRRARTALAPTTMCRS